MRENCFYVLSGEFIRTQLLFHFNNNNCIEFKFKDKTQRRLEAQTKGTHKVLGFDTEFTKLTQVRLVSKDFKLVYETNDTLWFM